MSFSRNRFPPLRQSTNYLVIAVLSVLLVLSVTGVLPTAIAPTSTSSAVAQVPVPANAAQSTNFVAAAVNRVGPAVVRLDTSRTISTRIPDPFLDDPFFRRFFGNELPPRSPQEYQQRGQGSGFIIDPSGIILTNAHVVSGADRVTVTLKDGRTLQGEVRGVDEPTDLAVVKINGSNLPVAPLGASSGIQVGDWAIAVGNPLGLDNTVTLGIISTLNRSSAQVGIPDKRLDFIQTDAAINPGNSGGPLLNDRGEVIGINTAIRAGAQGIGFAIPIDIAKEIQGALARGERIPHPYIGVQMRTLTPDLARQINRDPNAAMTVPEVNGVLVLRVLANSPAAAAGLRASDVVTAVSGQSVTSAEQLQNLIARSQINQALQMTVRRGSQTQQITVRTGELQRVAG